MQESSDFKDDFLSKDQAESSAVGKAQRGSMTINLARERQLLVDVLSAKVDKECHVAMMDILDEYRERFAAEKDRRLFVKPNIPKEKLAKAIEKYAQDVSVEDVGVLVDETPFGSASEGVLITHKHVYCRSLGKGCYRISLSDIEELLTHRDLRGGLNEIVVNGSVNLPVCMLNSASKELLVELLCSLCEPYRRNGDIKVLSKTKGQDDHIYNFTVLLPPLDQWLQTVGLSEYGHIFEDLKEKGGNRKYDDYTGELLKKKGIENPYVIEQICEAVESRNRDLHDIAQCRVEEAVVRNLSKIEEEEFHGFKELIIVAAKPYMRLGESVAQAITQSCRLKCKCVGVKQFASSGVSLRDGRRFLLIGDEKENEVVKRELANMEECFNELGVGIAYNNTYAIVFGEDNFTDEIAQGVATVGMILARIPGAQPFGLMGAGWAALRKVKKKKVCKDTNTRIGLMKFFMECFSLWAGCGTPGRSR